MRNSRILPLLGPAAALYLAADAAAAAGGLLPLGWVTALLGVALTLTPFMVRELIAAESPGARRVGTLGVALGVALVATLGPTAETMTRDLTFAVALPLAAAVVVDLALDVPDRIPWRRARMLLVLGAIVSGALGMAATLPAIEWFDQIWIAPPRLLAAPIYFAFASLGVAALARLGRRSWRSPPEALASSAWGLLGLLPMVGVAAVAAVLVLRFGLDPRTDALRLSASVAAAAMVYGHAAMVDPTKRLRAGPATREIVAWSIPVALGVGLAFQMASSLPRAGWPLAIVASAWFLGVLLVWRATGPWIRRSLAPHGGRLLAAIDRARRDMGSTSDLDELGAAVLAPMRRAAGDDSLPRLLTLAPSREVRVDAAGTARVYRATMPDALEARLAEAPGEVVVTDLLSGHVVRRPELRELVEVLEAWDALCIVPLGVRGELEGALVVPRGHRRVALSLEEIAKLGTLGEEIGTRVGLLGGRDRALQHVAELAARYDALEERNAAAEEERDRLRADTDELRAGRGRARQDAPPVAYSVEMRALHDRLREVAAQEAALTFIAEPGVSIDRLARSVHEESSRAGGPFVVADASGTRDTSRALLGDAEQPGWLRLAAGGTLLLADVPALDAAAQHALAEALALKQARPVDDSSAYSVDVRLVATSRLPLDPLVEVGAFDPELARWLGTVSLEIPPLRRRREDIPSLVMLALDRASRVLGRPPIGIAQAALDVLLAHDWPGNLRELQHVVDRAVARAEGPQVLRADLPLLAGTAPTSDPLEGTFAALEHRILERALRRAKGNKSEAARLLGLKRTTFLDKLKRQASDAESKSAPEREASPRG